MEVILNFVSVSSEWLLRFYEICVESMIWLLILIACVIASSLIGYFLERINGRKSWNTHWGVWSFLGGVAILFPIVFVVYGQSEHEMKMQQKQGSVKKELVVKEVTSKAQQQTNKK